MKYTFEYDGDLVNTPSRISELGEVGTVLLVGDGQPTLMLIQRLHYLLVLLGINR